MEVRVVSSIHGDNCRWGALLGEHPDEDEEGVVDPVEGRVFRGIETGGLEHAEHALGHGEVGNEFV